MSAGPLTAVAVDWPETNLVCRCNCWEMMLMFHMIIRREKRLQGTVRREFLNESTVSKASFLVGELVAWAAIGLLLSRQTVAPNSPPIVVSLHIDFVVYLSAKWVQSLCLMINIEINRWSPVSTYNGFLTKAIRTIRKCWRWRRAVDIPIGLFTTEYLQTVDELSDSNGIW